VRRCASAAAHGRPRHRALRVSEAALDVRRCSCRALGWRRRRPNKGGGRQILASHAAALLRAAAIADGSFGSVLPRNGRCKR